MKIQPIFENLLGKNPTKSVNESDDIDWALHEIYDEVKREIMSDYWDHLMQEKPGIDDNPKHLKARQPWEVIPFAMVERQWSEFMLHGEVLPRYERTIEQMEKLITSNILKVNVNTELAGHTSADPRHDWADFLDGREPEEKIPELIEYAYEYFGDYIEEPHGQYRLSDYGLKPLMERLSQLRKTHEPRKKLVIMDNIMSVLHMRSDIAAWFIEGGSDSLSKLSGQER